MNLNELQPAEGSKFALREWAEVSEAVQVKLREKVIKDKTQEVAVALDRALKVDRCLYTEDFLSVDLRIYLQKEVCCC